MAVLDVTLLCICFDGPRYKMKASGIKQAEPRLVMKTHRRISRHQEKQDLIQELGEVESLLGSQNSNKTES
jgi:hypothetical protein